MLLRTYAYLLLLKTICLLAGGMLLGVQYRQSYQQPSLDYGAHIFLVDTKTLDDDTRHTLLQSISSLSTPVGMIAWKTAPVFLVPPTHEKDLLIEQTSFLHEDGLPVLTTTRSDGDQLFSYIVEHTQSHSILRADSQTRDNLYETLTRPERAMLLQQVRDKQITLALLGEKPPNLRRSNDRQLHGTTLLALLLIAI